MASGIFLNLHQKHPTIQSTAVDHNFNYENAKLAFNQEVGYVLLEKKLQTRVVLHKEAIDDIINDIKQNKTHHRIYFTGKCTVVNENGKDILCQVKRKVGENNYNNVAEIKQILSLDDLFDILSELHVLKPYLNEAGIQDHFTNCILFKPFINLFRKSCECCVGIMRGLETQYRVIGEVTVFKMDSPDGKFKFIFMYIERNTSFVILKPMKSLSCKEIANELLAVFADFGPPTFLDLKIFNYHREDANVLNVLKTLDLPFNIPTLFSVRQKHKIDITITKAKAMLVKWMKDMGSSNWAIGAHAVQWMMNTNKIDYTYIRSKVVHGPIQSPYHAMFGMLPHTDIVKFKKKRRFNFTENTEPSLVDCSQCNLPIYKVLKCYFCKRLCHFSCCVRYVEEAILINKCISCVNIEEVIVGT